MFFISRKKFREEVERESNEIIKKREQDMYLSQNIFNLRDEIDRLKQSVDTMEKRLNGRGDGAMNRHVCGDTENGRCDDCILPY